MSKKKGLPILRVLHLEDSPMDAEIIKERLLGGEYDVKVDWATNQEQFIGFLQEETYDIVLADFHLPQFEAPQALKLLRTHSAELPFICISGAIGEEMAVELLKKGATDYVSKNNLDKLPLAVQRALDEVSDRNERKLAEEDFKNLQDYLSSIIDSMPSMIIGVNQTCQVTQWNRCAERITGVVAKDAMGQALDRLMPDLADEIDGINKAIITQEQTNQRRTIVRNELTIHEAITIYPLVTKGKQGAVVRIDDITGEYKLQEQLNQGHRMEAIGQLAGGVAHDFNNMLAGIMGAAQILKSPKRNLDDISMKYVNIIIDSASRTGDLTSKLLAFGRKGSLSSVPTDIHNIIDDTFTLLERTLDKKNHLIVEKKAKRYYFEGESSSIQNSIMNLVINGSQAMESGGELTLETGNRAFSQKYCDQSPFDLTPGDFIEISVKDSGSGISPNDQEKVFEPFFTTKEIGKGTGLGLATVYRTVQDHHGAITMDSKVGEGTIFRIFLPCSERNLEEQDKKNEQFEGAGTILLVDDEEIILETIAHLLSEMGYQVLTARNGEEAVEIFAQKYHIIDIVVSDMIMPKMDGREAFFKMKEIDPTCKFIISSGYSKRDDLTQLYHVGLAGFLQKPFKSSELYNMILSVLNS